MKLLHPRTLPEPGAACAETFFDVACPNLLALQAETCRLLPGTCAFDICGPRGGRWLIDFSQATVVRSREPAALVVTVSDDDFAALLSGELSADRALSERRLVMAGEPDVWACVAVLFSPPGVT